MPEQQPKDHEIREMLIQLHDELGRAQTLDEDERVMLRHLMRDIQQVLDHDTQPGEATAPAPHPAESLVDRMDKAVGILEISHPTLTNTIRKVLETLNVAGI